MERGAAFHHICPYLKVVENRIAAAAFSIRSMDEENHTSPPGSHEHLITAICQCLPQPDLKDWLPEGMIDYRDVCFFVLPDPPEKATRLSIVIDLGEITPAKRLDAYRHMAGYNLAKGAPDHGILALNPLSQDSAVHRLVLHKTDDSRPAEFAQSLHALASHALNFRASYAKRVSRPNLRFSRLVSPASPVSDNRGKNHGG